MVIGSDQTTLPATGSSRHNFLPEEENNADFAQKIAAMPRLLDDSDLITFRRNGIATAPVRRARREHFRELLNVLQPETERIAATMASAENRDPAEIVEFRRFVRKRLRRLRLLLFLHGLGIHVDKVSRSCSVALNAALLSPGRS